ncbi:MAG TPA: hypothetical protein ENG87_03900 [Candidatus Pacearchaeota archaeon]|nr:hypothetical protein [Candidatus Pacearchaeota archaeon]
MKKETLKGCGIEIMINTDWEEGYGIVNTIKNPATSILATCGKNGYLCPKCEKKQEKFLE